MNGIESDFTLQILFSNKIDGLSNPKEPPVRFTRRLHGLLLLKIGLRVLILITPADANNRAGRKISTGVPLLRDICFKLFNENLPKSICPVWQSLTAMPS